MNEQQPIYIPPLATPAVVDEEIIAREEAPKPKPKNDMSDLFEVPQPEDNDIYSEDLVSLDVDTDVMGGDLSSLTAVSNEDIIGRPPKPRYKIRRTGARRESPPVSFGGMR